MSFSFFLFILLLTGLASACDPGLEPTGAGGKCVRCRSGHTSLGGEALCTACDAGYHEVDNTCVSCPEGTFAPDPGSTFCQPCGPGAVARFRGQIQCVACPPNQRTVSARQCLECPSNFFVKLDACVTCPPGTRFDGTDCSSCPPGTYSYGFGTPECRQCRPGTFALEAGTRECTACELGYYAPGNGTTACKKCDFESTTYEVGATQCEPTSLFARAVKYEPPVSILLALVLFCLAAVVVFGALLFLHARRAIRANKVSSSDREDEQSAVAFQVEE